MYGIIPPLASTSVQLVVMMSGSNFSLFTKMHIYVKSVTCPLIQFVELYFKVFVFFMYVLPEHNFLLKQDSFFIC
jgi:hypothetical protein